MNPKIWKLLSDYMYDSYYGLHKLDKMSEEDYLPLYGKAEAVYGKGPNELNPLQRARLKLLPVDPPSWTKLLRQKEDETGGDPFRGINMETGRMQWMDDADDIDLYPESDSQFEWRAIQRAMADEQEKTSKEKKSRHSRRGGGGGALPQDLTGSGKTLPRGLVRRDKRKY